MFSVSACNCNTLVTPATLRCLKGQAGVSGQAVVKIKNFMIKPLIWLQGCPNERTLETIRSVAWRLGLSVMTTKSVPSRFARAQECLYLNSELSTSRKGTENDQKTKVRLTCLVDLTAPLAEKLVEVSFAILPREPVKYFCLLRAQYVQT